MQTLIFSPADFLDSIGIAIQNFEDRQRLLDRVDGLTETTLD